MTQRRGVAKAVPTTWIPAIEQYTTACRSGGAPDSTIRTRTDHLKRLARVFPRSPWTVTGAALTSWTGAQDWSVAYRRSFRQSLVNFYGWAVECGLIESSPAALLPTVKPAKPRPRPVPEIIYREALSRANDRSRMMLRLAAECGMRRGEVCQAHTRDVIEDLTGWSIIVHGKGGKQRIVPLPDDLAVELYVFCQRGYFFPGRINGHLSDRYVGTIVARLLPGTRTMHKLRHKFATDAFAIDSNIVAVQELLGHDSPVTTRAYVALPDDALRATINAMQDRRRLAG